MAYSASELTLLSHGNGFHLYRYDTEDSSGTVDTAEYFNDAVDQLNVGDLILVVTWSTAIRTGTISSMGWHIVLSNDGTDVDVSDATAIATTDTD